MTVTFDGKSANRAIQGWKVWRLSRYVAEIILKTPAGV